MTVAGHRHERIAEEIHHELDAMLAGELADPRLEVPVNVTEVRVLHGLKLVRVYVAVTGSDTEKKAAMKGLQAAAGFIRRELLERLRLRRSPELLFVLDESEARARRIEELLKDAGKKASDS